MRLSFIVADSTVYIDGVPYEADQTKLAERDVVAIQFNGVKSITEYTPESGKGIEAVSGLARDAEAIYLAIDQTEPPPGTTPPGPESNLIILKRSALEAVIDYVALQIPDDPLISAYLEEKNNPTTPGPPEPPVDPGQPSP